MTDLKSLDAITSAMHGWTSLKERKFLYKEAKKVKNEGAIVEVGSWKGRSTIWLAQGSKDGSGSKIYAIDHFIGSSEHQSPGKPVWTFDEFKNNIKMAGLEDLVEPIVANSESAAKNWYLPIKFIFIDGAHEYEEVKKDFMLWHPFLAESGVIALHDCAPDIEAILGGLPIFGLPGPREVAEKYILSSANFCRARLTGSIVSATKCERRSVWGFIYSQICKIKIFFRYVLYRCYLIAAFSPGPVKKIIKSLFVRNKINL
ncbi:class I SAM-dependent methyltransferase [Patescibacteria group bacterium]|nr:class I SAM-dependent methyltransferase [Patescibacteria group bacterium]MBU2264629.1 class I SAM-dependent methyltransferase [Patescibacteria group bacterium]